MTRPLLYTYRRCPYAMRARMALLQASIGFDAHEIVLRHKPLALLTVSPKGTVPVLVLPDGRVIEQSLDIMRWAFEGRDHEGWWRRAQGQDNQALIALNDGPFKQHLDCHKYPERLDGTDRASHRDRAVVCLLQPLAPPGRRCPLLPSSTCEPDRVRYDHRHAHSYRTHRQPAASAGLARCDRPGRRRRRPRSRPLV